jgi:hypothetical protein
MGEISHISWNGLHIYHTGDAQMKLLAICTSYRRPKMLWNMLQTFRNTKNHDTDIFIYLHLDDPFLEEYKVFINDYPHIIERHRNLQQVINHVVFERYPGVPYYQIICDDHLYHTQNWDNLLTEAISKKAQDWGFCCGRDLVNGDNWHRYQHPSAEIWSWKMAKTLGYIYPHIFEHQGLDFYTKDLSLAINALTFVPEVIIEHLWYGGCNKPMDDNIKEKYDDDTMARAHKAFDHWKRLDKDTAIRKINEARSKE